MKDRWKCCVDNATADTGLYARGMHNHAATPSAVDHATGTSFQHDKSTTEAVARRMRGMPFWLKGRVEPLAVAP